jgi:hypothetical protein
MSHKHKLSFPTSPIVPDVSVEQLPLCVEPPPKNITSSTDIKKDLSVDLPIISLPKSIKFPLSFPLISPPLSSSSSSLANSESSLNKISQKPSVFSSPFHSFFTPNASLPNILSPSVSSVDDSFPDVKPSSPLIPSTFQTSPHTPTTNTLSDTLTQKQPTDGGASTGTTTTSSSNGSGSEYNLAGKAANAEQGQVRKGKWTPLEDQMLKDVVAEVAPDRVKDWLIVCRKIPNRSHKQCRGIILLLFLFCLLFWLK